MWLGFRCALLAPSPNLHTQDVGPPADRSSKFTGKGDTPSRGLAEAVEGYQQVEVAAFTGLTAHFAQKRGIYTIIRSLRTTTEFELELATALSNRQLDERLETVFLAPGLQYTHLSSTVVREIAQFGGQLAQFVPPKVADRLLEKFPARPIE